MKKLLVIIVLGLLLSENVYAFGCNLKISKLKENYAKERLEISIYNPNTTKVMISGIFYYDSKTLLRKPFDVHHFVDAQSSLNFTHVSSTSFLKLADNIKFKCNVISSASRKNFQFFLEWTDQYLKKNSRKEKKSNKSAGVVPKDKTSIPDFHVIESSY